MHAFPSPGRIPARRTGLIVVAVLAVAALAAGAALLEPAEPPAQAASDPQVMAAPPSVAPAAPLGDSSLPSAAAVFGDRRVAPEEPAVTF